VTTFKNEMKRTQSEVTATVK